MATTYQEFENREAALSATLGRIHFYLSELILEMESKSLTRDVVLEKVKDILKDLKRARQP